MSQINFQTTATTKFYVYARKQAPCDLGENRVSCLMGKLSNKTYFYTKKKKIELS